MHGLGRMRWRRISANQAALANFAMALAGGFLAGHAKEAGNLNGTVSGGIAGLVAVAAAADTYHPLQTFLIAAGLAAVGLWWRERLARRNGIDDVTGTVALHGIVGFLGLALSGIILWTYPASPGPEFSPYQSVRTNTRCGIRFWIIRVLARLLVFAVSPIPGSLAGADGVRARRGEPGRFASEVRHPTQSAGS